MRKGVVEDWGGVGFVARGPFAQPLRALVQLAGFVRALTVNTSDCGNTSQLQAFVIQKSLHERVG